MAMLNKVAQVARKLAGQPGPRVLVVGDAWRLTPNMIRVVFAGLELDGFPEGREGGNWKLLMPGAGESKDAFWTRLQDGAQPVRRVQTCTTGESRVIRALRGFLRTKSGFSKKTRTFQATGR